jgi:hypothetical protein
MQPTTLDETIVRGTLHVNIAFDWGDEIDLRRAAQLAPSHEQELVRRPRTPESIGYRPAPLRFPLGSAAVDFPGLEGVEAHFEASVFDFSAVNIRVDIAIAHSAATLRTLTCDQALLQAVGLAARKRAEPLYKKLLPAIKAPEWRDVTEDYVIFQFDPASLPTVDQLLNGHAEWLAGLLRLEPGPLSSEQTADALVRRISYAPGDLVIVDWGAAVVVDHDCEETLQALEFANLQLLEFRLIDRRLDQALTQAYGLTHSLTQSRRFFFLRTHDRPLRMLGDIKIETEMLFERAGKALKLVGDQYLSRVYRLAAARLHLEEWSQSVKNSLEVVEGVYQVLSDQASAARLELMEAIVIGLIAVEIILTLAGH